MLAAHGLTADRGGAPLFEDLGFTLERSRSLAVIGRSGCGKSTLLDVLAGLVVPARGRVSLDGEDITGRPGRCSLMPQHSLLLPWRDLAGNAALALEIGGLSKRAARARVMPHLGAFDLAGKQALAPHQLSGGMQRRVGLLRAWLHGSPVLLLDEPFSALDAITRRDMHRWYLELVARTALSALIVTHDIDEALILADRLLVFARDGSQRTMDVPDARRAKDALKARIVETL